MTKHLVTVATLSLALGACATEPEITTLPKPTQAAIDYANHLESCDPAFGSQLAALTSDQTVQLTTEPMPALQCRANDSLLAGGGCHFVSWWNWAGFTDRAACVVLGLPLCYASICLAAYIDS